MLRVWSLFQPARVAPRNVIAHVTSLRLGTSTSFLQTLTNFSRSMSHSCVTNDSSLVTQLPPHLKPSLTPKQLAKAVKMVARGVSPLPEHWFLPGRGPLSAELPRPGALVGSSLPLRKCGGRNHHGKITVRHRGGGFKRRIRILDTKRTDWPGECRVERIEHDPNRSAKIALVRNLAATETPEWRYILAAEGMKEGAVLSNWPPREGATLPLRDIVLGTVIHNVECTPGRGGQLVRSAGTMATLVGKDLDGKCGTVRLPSGTSKRLPLQCTATIGRVGNCDWQHRVIGKAGRMRNLGRRPKVRGVAMNAVDHPHGGGKGGKSKGKPSQSIWGWVCK